MNNNNSSKQILLSVLGVAILVVAVVGISFAAFSYSRAGENPNTITTGTITMNYSEDTNGIKLENALPMTDPAGKVLADENQYFDFTVSSTMSGTATINYAVTAVKTGDSTLPDTGVKVYLTKRSDNTSSMTETAVSSYPTKVSALDKVDATVKANTGAIEGEYLLDQGTFTANNESTAKTQSVYYRLRMWVADDYAETNNGVSGQITQKTYTLKVNVYGTAAAQQ